MWLIVARPASIDPDAVVTIAKTYVEPDQRLKVGDILCDLTVEIGSEVTRDCPAVSTCRIVMQEGAWVRVLALETGGKIEPGALLALLSTESAEAPAPAARPARIAAVAVLMHADWWLSES